MRTLPPAADAPASLRRIADRVGERVATLLDAESARWVSVDPELAAPFAALRGLVLGGGKRLRPAFCHWAFVGAGGDGDDPAVVDAGAALELLHTFALIHDDVMDGSSTRRSMDTIHVRFEELHALDGWRGEGRRFGEGVAILVGDLAFVYADQLLASAPPVAKAVFTELRIEVNVGQYLDLAGTAKGDVGEGTARRISLFKSGKYTVERPLHLGAALAGRLPELAAPLSAYGLPLGQAFQMRDDLLGVFGDESLTGKPVGEDLREGKPTLLFAAARTAVDRNGSHAASRLLARYGAPDITDDEVADLLDLLVETGAVGHVEDTIERLVDESLAALAAGPLAGEATTMLGELARYIAARDR